MWLYLYVCVRVCECVSAVCVECACVFLCVVRCRVVFVMAGGWSCVCAVMHDKGFRKANAGV